MSMPSAVLNGRAHDGGVAEVDPAARPRRRQFSAEYKLAVLAEYDAAPDGEKGSILRREGLYSSHVTEWRRARDVGAAGALESRTRGSKRHPAEVEHLLLQGVVVLVVEPERLRDVPDLDRGAHD